MIDANSDGRIDTLLAVIKTLFPDRPARSPRRMIHLDSSKRLGATDLARAIDELAIGEAARHVDAPVVVKLLDEVASFGRRENANFEPLRAKVVAHVQQRWADLADDLARLAVDSYDRQSILAAFPELATSPELIARLADHIAEPRGYVVSLDELMAEVSPTSIAEARRLIAAVVTRKGADRISGDQLVTPLFCAIGRGIGWTKWTTLFAILQARPAYAEAHATFERSSDRARESQPAIDARLELARRIEPETRVREVAAQLLDLMGDRAGRTWDGLLARPAETRAAYVMCLADAIGNDAELRQAVIEALLWFAEGSATDLAQFAAVAVACAEDRDALTQLDQHPVRHVRYAARAVRTAKFGERHSSISPAVTGGLLQRLLTLEGSTSRSDEFAKTWLGDRAVERLIEQTIDAVESRFAREYVDHGDEGEDRLLASLFMTLAMRLQDLDYALEALARAASAPHRASIAMRYRNVDRAEEGSQGINGARRFSADLCLIVDPVLNGVSLGRRVTLVQAKRLYRNTNSPMQPEWHYSFHLDVEQRAQLLQQTHSSVYFFQGPPLGGRGVPVIPTRLVGDLAEHQGSGSELAHATVAAASRSLADWLTYDALALRVGDPLQNLVDRAEGRPGSMPRALLSLPTVEIDIAIAPRSGGDRYAG